MLALEARGSRTGLVEERTSALALEARGSRTGLVEERTSVLALEARGLRVRGVRGFVLGLPLFAATLCGCGDPAEPPSSRPADAPTYVSDVAPILARECTSCHSSGGIAPFPLDRYEAAAQQAGAIARVTRARTMPPFGVDNSGSCNTYQDARWLSDAELDLLQRWSDAGAPMGTGVPVLIRDQHPARALHATATLDTGALYTPNSDLTDDYRCFVVDLDRPATSYLTGFAVHPGDARIVHHIILYALASDDSEAKALDLDASDPGPGYTCFGGPGTNDIRFLAGWAPGVRETHYPAGTGIEVPAHHKAVMQIHYHPIDERLPDRTTIDLELSDTVDLPAVVLPLADLQLSLAPGQPIVTATTEATLDQPPAVDVYGVFPHMHRLGRALSVSHTPAGATSSSCLVDVPRWTFEWQQFYFYDHPLRINVGDRVELTCAFDTTSRTTPTTWGEGTDDEMCLAGFYIVKQPS